VPDLEELRPICFMVMPFNRRKVEGPTGEGAPGELDCNALWDKAFRPAIAALGYIPVRADADPGSVIVKDMFERLALADLVLADVTLPNGNVYYEIGMRHVAKQTHCVLLAADWSRQLFDIQQLRTLRYTLRGGGVPDAEAAAIQELIGRDVPRLAAERTPYHALLASSRSDIERGGVFRDQARRLSEFQAEVRAARLVDALEARQEKVREIEKRFAGVALTLAEVAAELLCLIRDTLGWSDARRFIESLPAATRDLPFVREQYQLAIAKLGDPAAAIARLEALVAELGATPERLGLIGGRHKQLWRDARKAREARGETKPGREERRHLENAIESYTRGMQLDYNEYYCSCNVPTLLRARGNPGDADQATLVDHLVVAACERALERGHVDEWLRPTLLGAAFRAGDVPRARDLVKRIGLEGAAVWMLETTFPDLEQAVRQTRDASVAQALGAALEEVDRMRNEEAAAPAGKRS
jgi:hypothetical protein